MFSTILEQMMRAIADAARIPVIIALFCFLAFSLFSIGMTAMEAWGERRYLDYHLPGLLEELQDCKPNRIRARIKGSGLLTRHKDILLELASHPSFGQDMLESLADNLMEKEQAHYDHILSMTALTARLAPMAGLLGTLIPLGPGITALGSGDVQTLSSSASSPPGSVWSQEVSADAGMLSICQICRHWRTASWTSAGAGRSLQKIQKIQNKM